MKIKYIDSQCKEIYTRIGHCSPIINDKVTVRGVEYSVFDKKHIHSDTEGSTVELTLQGTQNHERRSAYWWLWDYLNSEQNGKTIMEYGAIYLFVRHFAAFE